MFRIHRFLVALLGSFILTGAGAAFAGSYEVNASAGLTLQGVPLALRGYDPVSYFTDGTPLLGRAEHSVVHGGAAYRFASAEHQRRFEADPERYLPQYGGFCAFGVSVGAKFDGDPQVWRVANGKLYLNLNSEIQKKWKNDIPGAVRKADANWPKIRAADPATLKP